MTVYRRLAESFPEQLVASVSALARKHALTLSVTLRRIEGKVERVVRVHQYQTVIDAFTIQELSAEHGRPAVAFCERLMHVSSADCETPERERYGQSCSGQLAEAEGKQSMFER